MGTGDGGGDQVWNLMDFGIVASGVLDTWIIPLIEMGTQAGKKKHSAGVLVLLMRMARLLRIVRLFRLVKIVRPLYNLAQGILEAFQGMFWVLVFMMIGLYAIAILCTRMIGHGALIPQEALADPDVQKAQARFQTVGTSMFTLFETMSGWTLVIFQPLFDELPFFRPCFVIFYIYAAWGLLAVMTGVVSENMMAIREQMKLEEVVRETERKALAVEVLLELFRSADEDDGGEICREEFDSLMTDPAIVRKLERYTTVSPADLAELFDWIDADHDGNISQEEFVTGFKLLNEDLSVKTIIRSENHLKHELGEMERRLRRRIEDKLEEFIRPLIKPVRKIGVITEQLQILDTNFQEFVNTGTLGTPSPRAPDGACRPKVKPDSGGPAPESLSFTSPWYQVSLRRSSTNLFDAWGEDDDTSDVGEVTRCPECEGPGPSALHSKLDQLLQDLEELFSAGQDEITQRADEVEKQSWFGRLKSEKKEKGPEIRTRGTADSDSNNFNPNTSSTLSSYPPVENWVHVPRERLVGMRSLNDVVSEVVSSQTLARDLPSG